MPTKGASKRSSTTCAECRARKVRCDGKRENCSGCERLKLNCSFSRRDTHVDGIAQPDASLSGRKKKTACISCRSLKAKCGGELPSCMRCLRKRTPCRYPSSNRPQDGPIEARKASSQTRDVTTEPTGQARIEEAPSALDSTFVLRMIEAFFQHVHPIPVYSYFHKASLVQRFESGLLDHTLVLALAGTTCELLDMGADLTQKSTTWMSHAELGVMKELGRPSVIKVQALVLLVMHHMRQGRLGNAFMLHAVASRSAFALGLNYEAPKLGFLACESRRRLMWSLYIIDNRLAGGMSDFAICSASSIHVQLPCHERNFEFDLPQITKHLTPACVGPLPESIGSLAVYVQLMWYRHRVLQTTREAVLNSAMTMDRLTTSIEQLGNELSTFEMNLPESLKFSSKSLQLRAYSTRLGPYLLIHVWLRQCQCDLYRIALTGLKEAMPGERLQQIDPSTIESWRRNCLSNAMILASVFSQFTTLKNGCPVVEHDVIICAYQCARLLLHCSKHYSSALQIDRLAVLDNASQCLAAIQAIPSRSHIGESIVSTFAHRVDFANVSCRHRTSRNCFNGDHHPVHRLQLQR